MSELIQIVGGSPEYQREIRTSLRWIPTWFIQAAGLTLISVDASDEVKREVAIYRHGTRSISLFPNLGVQLLRKALTHEMAHGVDDLIDIKGHPHFYSASDVWIRLSHRAGEPPVEYFAKQLANYVMLGHERFKIRHPDEHVFFSSWVVPTARSLR